MIPLNIAKALQRVMLMSEPPEGRSEHCGVRLTSHAEDTLVFAEAANAHALIQVLFDSEAMEADEWDVVISRKSLKMYINSAGSLGLECRDFEEDMWPRDTEEVLDRVRVDRNPTGVSFWEHSGLQLRFIFPLVEALQDIYGSNAGIKISQQSYTSAISFKVELSDEVAVETLIALMPKLLWDGD